MFSLGFRKTETVGTKEIFKQDNKFYYFARGRYFPIKKSVVEQSELA